MVEYDAACRAGRREDDGKDGIGDRSRGGAKADYE